MSADIPVFPPTDAWVAAIHASEDDFRPIGTGLVIDLRHVLTCAHVAAREGVLHEPLWVAFPKVDKALGRRCHVTSVTIAENPQVADVAVLTLDQNVPAGVAPAPLRRPRPADLVGRRWWAFGFANSDALGNSADGVVGASLGYGWVRLDAESRYHVERGFSGGGLWSPDYEAVTALVGEANARGDGRAITLHQADLFLQEVLGNLTGWSAESAGELALAAWGWTLTRDPEAQRHWRPRARGVSIDSERGYRFRGRTAALTAIVDWLDRPSPDRRALVVTGAPGVGKSAVLGRVVTTADPVFRAALPSSDTAVRASPAAIACAVHAKAKTAFEVATEIARGASARLPDDAEDIGPAVHDALSDRGAQRFNVIIDALDEAVSPAQARAIIGKIVLPLVETCSDVGVQVVVGSRRRDDDGDLLAPFGDAQAVVDLDDPRYFADADIAAYAMACLQRTDDERSDNPYANDAVADVLARRIAELADRNFLIAGLIARAHGLHDQHPTQAHRLEFTATVDAALTSYLQQVSPVMDLPAMALLTALAFAESPGWPVALWLRAIEAIGDGKHTTAGQLLRFARSSAGNFLVESSADGRDAIFRLFHQALNDALLRARSRIVPRGDDELALSQAFLQYGKQESWERAPAYLRRSLSAHAARAGIIDDLLTDDGYLLHADLRRLIPLADHAAVSATRQRARMLQLTPQAISADPQTRAALFSVTEALEHLGNSYSSETWSAPYRALWGSAKPRTERTVLEGHTGWVNGVCTLTLGDQLLLASASDDNTVRIWDPATGEHRATLEGHASGVTAVCVFTTGERTLLASAGADRTVRIWEPAIGRQRAILEGHTSGISGVCAFTLGDQVRLASASDDGTVRIWDPATGEQQAILEGHTGGVLGVCAFSRGSQALLASAGADRAVRVWDPATGEQQAILVGHTGGVNGICAFVLGHRVLLASAGDDRTVRIWNPATGGQHVTLEGHVGGVRGLYAFTSGDQTLLASAGADATVRIWDPATGELRVSVDGHVGGVNGMCAFTLGNQVLLASAGADATVRIWDPAPGEQKATPDGHVGGVNGVCAFTLGDQVRLASASDDRTVRVWDPATGEQQAILEGHTGGVLGVCAFSRGSQALLASAGADRAVRVWDPATGEQQAILEGHTGWVLGVCAFKLGDEVRLASAGADATIRIWDPVTGEHRATLEGHAGWLNGLCTFTLGDEVLLASAGADATIRIFDPATHEHRATLEGHADWVRGICVFTLGDQILLASASDDRTVRIFDPAKALCLLTIPVHHAAQAVCWAGDSLALGLAAGVLAIELNSPVGRSM